MTAERDNDQIDQNELNLQFPDLGDAELESYDLWQEAQEIYFESKAEPTGVIDDWQEVYEYTRKCVRQSKALRSDAEDIVQYVVKRLHRENLQVRHWKAYVRIAVINRVIDLYRKRKRENQSWHGLPEPGAEDWQTVRTIFDAPILVMKPQELSIELASNSVVAHILSEVPQNHRELFIDYLEGVPLDDLAEIYGYASARSVSQTISRIKNNLRKRFASDRALFGEFD